MSTTKMRRRWVSQMTRGRLGIAAISYVAVDYMRYVSPTWHSRLQPVLWSVLVLSVLTRVPFYKHWSSELRAAIPFLASILFMLSALLFDALCFRSVTVVLGLDWHRDTAPLPDTCQWFLLALNESLPETIVEILRAHIIGLHHFLMLFVMLGFLCNVGFLGGIRLCNVGFLGFNSGYFRIIPGFGDVFPGLISVYVSSL